LGAKAYLNGTTKKDRRKGWSCVDVL